MEGAFLLLAVGTVGGILLWAFAPARRLPRWLPAAVAVVGSAGLAGWGAWLLVVEAANTEAAQQATGLMTLTHVAQVATGLAVLGVVVRFARTHAKRQSPWVSASG